MLLPLPLPAALFACLLAFAPVGVDAASAPCTYVEVSPKPANLTCGVVGTVSKPSSLIPAYAASNQTACRNDCLGRAACKSFSFNSQNKQCNLASVDVKSQQFKATSTGTNTFWHRQCYTQSCPSSTTSTSSSASKPTSSPSAHPSASTCGADVTKLAPAVNADVNTTQISNLTPSKAATLYYKEKSPGTAAAVIALKMNTPQVTLEYSSLIASVVCNTSTIAIKMKTQQAFNAIKSWPQSALVLITKSTGCNPTDQRGIYLVNSFTTQPNALVLNLQVQTTTLSVVADTLDIKYGDTASASGTKAPHCSTTYTHPTTSKTSTTTTATSKTSSSSTTTSKTSSSTSTTTSKTSSTTTTTSKTSSSTTTTTSKTSSSTTTTSKTSSSTTTTSKTSSSTTSTSKTSASITPTSKTSSSSSSTINMSPHPTSTADLSPAAKEMVNQLSSNLQYDAQGRIIIHPIGGSTQSTALAAQSVDLNNTSLQTRLETAAQAAGLQSADQIFQDIRARLTAASGGCIPPSRLARRLSRFSSANSTSLGRRDDPEPEPTWDDYVWEVACNEVTSAVVENDFADGICAAKEVYEQREALACFFSSCFWDLLHSDPGTNTNFDFSWSADFKNMNGRYLLGDTKGQYLQCVSCSFSILSFRLEGTISVSVTTGELKAAAMTAHMDAHAELIMELSSVQAFSGTWSKVVSTTNFDAITMPGVFTMTPEIIYSIGVNYETDSAVEFQAGARMDISQATTSLDMKSGTSGNAVNWQPTVDLVSPTFTSASKVRFIPFYRTAVTLSFQMFGKPFSNMASIITQTAVGFDAATLPAVDGNCAAGSLRVQRNVATKNGVKFGDAAQQMLFDKTQSFQPTCFNVPADQPSSLELGILKQSGGDFCTSFISYEPTWGPQEWDVPENFQPVSLTWEEKTCPCAY